MKLIARKGTKPSEWFSRRQALALVFAGLVTTYGVDEAYARAIRGGIAISGGGGGSESTLTPWTVKNNTGSAMTNVPIEIYVPFSPTVDPIGGGAGLYPFASADAIKLYDSDGTTVIPCQEDNRSSDLTPDVRGLKLTAILPSLGANTTKQLTVKKITSTSPQSGTDITAAEIIAAASEPCLLTMDYKDGNTYTASAATAIQASTSWTNKTTAFNGGKWRGNSNGGYVTEYVCYCPFSRSSGTIFTTNNLGAWFCISAFKAGSGAVNGGNPIIGVSVKYWIECGWSRITANTAAAHFFDLTATSGSNTQSWVGSSPAKTLTLSGLGTGYYDATVPTATWDANSVGMVLSDGTGWAMIVGVSGNTSTSVRVYQGKPFASTTTTSGNWRMYGINHEYASSLPQQEIWYNGGLSWTAKPDIYSHLGTAWNGTAGGPFTYLRDTRSILPFTTPQSSITNTMTNINLNGTNPTGQGQGGTADIAQYMPTTGGRDDIAPVLGYHVGPLIKFDSNAWTKIFKNGYATTMAPYQYRDDNTGKVMRFDNGTDWVYNPDLGSNKLPRVSNYYHGNYPVSDWTPQIAHHPCCYHTPFLLTGDFFWAEKMHQQLFWLWTETPTGYYGGQLNRGFCQASEQRGNGWNFRDIFVALMVAPDRDFGMLYPRSHITTIYDNQFTYTGSGTIGTTPYPGINTTCVNNTGSGKAFATSGDRYIGAIGTATTTRSGRNSLWQLGYGISAFFLGKCMGMLNSNASAFMTWAMEGVVGHAVDSAVNTKWFPWVYYMDLQDVSGTYVNTWAEIYRACATEISASGSGLNRRLITGTGISLSATSGSAVTFTAPAGYFNAGGIAFYANGQVRDFSACSLQVTPMAANARAGFDAYAEQFDVGTSSNSRTLVTNAGTIKVWNTGSKTIYVKLSVGASTATTSDTAITAGNYGKFTVGANTYINYIAAAGAGTPVAVVYGSKGSGYANGDTITCSVNSMGSFTLQTAPVLTVNDVGAAGDVVDVSVTTPGRYTTSSVNASRGDTLTQTATSGSGTGFSYRASSQDDNSSSPMRFGTGFITGVNTSTNVITIDTTLTKTGPQGEIFIGCPFAQTSLVTNLILAPAPYPGDADGGSGGPGAAALPTPYSGGNEFWTIQLNCAKLAEAFGFTNGAAAKAAIAAAYVGSEELKWRMVS